MSDSGHNGSRGLSRRAFLRGAGTVAISLPFLDFMTGGPTAQASAVDAPKRLVTFFFPNGSPKELWLPDSTGASFAFRGALEPLAALKDKIALVSGLHDPAAKEGSGDPHSRGGGAFAVGWPNPFLEIDPVDSGGKRYAHSAGGPSLEQFALQMSRPNTYLGSLEIGVMREPIHTRTYHVKSWRGVNQPNPPIVNPLNTFRRIFGEAEPNGDGQSSDRQSSDRQEPSSRQERYQRSVLDTVVGEYDRVTSERYGLSRTSRAMLSDHLDAVRDLERRAVRIDADLLAACQRPEAPRSYEDTLFSEYEAVFDLQAELLAMALRCDVTRYASVMTGCGAEDLELPGLEGPQHKLGHEWSSNRDNDFLRYNRFQMQLLSTLLQKLDEPSYLDANNQTVLDNTILLAGTEISNPSSHSHDEKLYMVCGGAGQVRTGYHHRAGDGTNRAANDLYSACLRAVGLEVERFGDPRFNVEPLWLG
jgi:hypothetical protein